MHMWMWFGYDLGDFLFPGLTITSRWSFALTWIALFFVALLYEGSKVYLARVQREALKKLWPHRSDERRNLLCDREAGNIMEPTTSRNASTGQVSRWASVKVKMLVNVHQSTIFVIHSTVGYLLMLAVMIYNVHLLLAVVFGTMLGYFLFGVKLTRLQMQCFGTKRVVICTPECDDTAETTPPQRDSPGTSESDFLVCQTRSCVQPSHYFPSTSQPPPDSCHYGAKKCPSKVAKVKKDKEDSPSVEDAQLLRVERQTCCKKKGAEGEQCCKESSVVKDEVREQSPEITCCKKSESQEHIIA